MPANCSADGSNDSSNRRCTNGPTSAAFFRQTRLAAVGRWSLASPSLNTYKFDQRFAGLALSSLSHLSLPSSWMLPSLLTVISCWTNFRHMIRPSNPSQMHHLSAPATSHSAPLPGGWHRRHRSSPNHRSRCGLANGRCSWLQFQAIQTTCSSVPPFTKWMPLTRSLMSKLAQAFKQRRGSSKQGYNAQHLLRMLANILTVILAQWLS